MRIAFFGGSFDPPHRGHLAIAHAALERLHLDEVLFAPVGVQPLKRDAQPASFDDRAAMVELAIAGNTRLRLSLLDAPQGGRETNYTDGRKPNYTVDTLLALRQSLAGIDELFCLLGADSFLTLHNWRRAAELLFVCDFIVAARPGFDIEDAARSLPAGVYAEDEVLSGPGYIAQRLRDGAARVSTLYLLPDLREDVSATEIRQALVEGAESQSALDPAVVRYIRERELYRERR